LPARFRYYTASRGSDALRAASVHRVVVGPPARFLAVCHRTDTLKWFRVDNVFEAAVDEHGTFRDAPIEEVEGLLAGTLDGFFDARSKKELYTVWVREPEARWVKKNLLDGMRVEDTKDGVRITVETTAVERLARWVVGLGEAARAENGTL